MNSYEPSEVFNVATAHELILGEKVIDPISEDDLFGQGYRDLPSDIDESDE